MSSFRDALARGRQQLNPLSTTLPVAQSYPTPLSDTSSLSTPFGYHSAPYTPTSAVRQYNPQQWGPSAVAPESGMRYTPGSAGTEAPGPPPYSPPRSNRPAAVSAEEAASSHGTSLTHLISPSHGIPPAHHISPAPIHRPSPEPASAPVFPPPPGAGRSRAMSRDRPTTKFNFGWRQNGHDSDLAAQRERGGLALRSLHLHTGSLYSPEEPINLSPGGRPPAARRAASAGAIETPTHAKSPIPIARWENGMPIPPPPPCPPPHVQSRSQSMGRTPDSVLLSAPTRRPQPISNLGPVPPTPADWQEEDAAGLRGKSPNRGLQIDTTGAVATPPAEVNSGATSGGSSGLSRTPAVRGEPRSIRERRSESRTAQRTAMEEPLIMPFNPSGQSVMPSDITVPPVSTLTRRATINKSTPRSARGVDGLGSAKSVGHGTPTLAQHDGSEPRGQTPPTAPSSKNNLESPTPPFSPNHNATFPKEAPHVAPRSLPTPPPQPRRSGSPHTRAIPNPHLDSSATTPVSPRKRVSAQSNAPNFSSDFVNEAIQRHNEFAKKEDAAIDDEERVRLFAEFVVSESRLRRERYASAIDAMGSEILELTRDLFRPYSKAERSSLRRASDRSDKLPTMQTDSAQNSRPGSSASSVVAASPPIPQGESAHYINGYRPSLSPIASMATSDNPDESSSRGRPPSRWWETYPETPVVGLGRSKRESKYMGVPKEARESLQWEDSGPTSSNTPTMSGSSSHTMRGFDEYPPEKAEFYDDSTSAANSKTPTSAAYRQHSPVLPATPNPKQLDVSRLVTLPPPYPRHHPAVNNNHPDLTDIRDAVRAMSDFSLARATREQFDIKANEVKQEAANDAAQRKQALRANIIHEIDAGTMSYADAAKAEAESTATEADNSKAQAKAAFERFQTAVVGPLNDLFMDRIHQSTTLFDQLRGQLFVDAQQQNPNMPQEQGDEQPELLEKLTLLKWIFEARESLHRQIYDLLTDRNNQYRDMIIGPYRLVGNNAKVANAEAFFAADGRKRALEYEDQSLTRTVEFMDVVETNIIRGVEVQLGAFWDIAPNLRQIIEKVPTKLTRDFSIVIPQEEYEENPEYAQFPLQYLYHLLEHGEKSTYQFIESQINLLCLLHEVKSAVASVRGRVDEAEAASQGGDVQEDVNAIRQGMEGEERRLTDDLKEKVRCVEELWSSGIGVEFQSVKKRVKDFLIGEGGWEGVENVV